MKKIQQQLSSLSPGEILSHNKNIRREIPLPLLLCFSLFVTWQMGIIFFSSNTLSIGGRTPLPIDVDSTTLLVVAGYILSILFMLAFPRKIVWAERISAAIALAAIAGLFLPTSPETQTILFYIHYFFCIFMIGFETALMVNLFSERSTILHLTLMYPAAEFLVAILQNEWLPIPFSVFHIFSIVALIGLLIFFFYLPGNEWPLLVQKNDGFIRPKKFFSKIYLLLFLGGLLTLFGNSIAETVSYGVSIYYTSAAVIALILFFLWKNRSIHPLTCCPYLVGLSALGFLLVPVSQYFPVIGTLTAILAAAGMAMLSLYALMGIAIMNRYPSRTITPVIVFLAFLTVLIHTAMLEAFRDSETLLCILYFSIAVAVALLYFVLQPHLIYAFHTHPKETVEMAAETSPSTV
ncbi:MAG: hypothetical protein IJA25_06105, partial [Anaerotignum sp.]|nr:hypothetical protein [Anaerotignum sp.]